MLRIQFARDTRLYALVYLCLLRAILIIYFFLACYSHYATRRCQIALFDDVKIDFAYVSLATSGRNAGHFDQQKC